MEELESFLTREGVDLRKDVEEEVQRVLGSSELMRPFAKRVGQGTGSVELERGLHACALIGSKEKGFSAILVEEVTVQGLVKLIDTERENVAVQKKLMYLVNVLAVDETVREDLVDGGVGEATVAVMNAHMRVDVVLERTLMALSRLSLGKLQHKLKLAAAGAIRALVEVLDKNGTNETLCMTCAIALRNLVHGCPENCMLAKQLGVPKLLLDVTRSFPKAPQVQVQLLLTMVTMTRLDDDLRQSLGNDERYVTPIVSVVKSSEESRQMTELSLELLAYVVGGRSEATLNRLGADNFIPILAERLRLYRAMAFTKQNRDLMRVKGGLQATVDTLKALGSNATVAEQCLCVLSNVCFGSHENQELIGKIGGVQETVKVMELHRDSESIQDFGCRALRNFANNCDYNIRLEGEVGAVQGIVLAMMSFPDVPSLNEQGVAALLNLTRLEQNSLRMLEHDVPEVIHNSLQNIDSDELNKKSTRLINILETPGTNSVETSLTRSLSRGLSRSLSRGTSVSMSRAKTEQLRERGMSRRISRMRSQSQQRLREEEDALAENALKSAFHGLKRAVSTRARD